jgi:enterochelin esterase family protein
MKIFSICFLVVTLTAAKIFAAGEDAFYKLGPDSLPQDGVPKGKIEGPFTNATQVFPGSSHTYWIYVPAQYDPNQPAALMIFNDGAAMKDPTGDMRVPNVLDNLIWRRELPVMITVFINPAHTPSEPEPTLQTWGDQTTRRPEEYNKPDDTYARVICGEILPLITNRYNINPDPDMHAIGGSSSGAIAAFSVAWARPDQFHKVFSNVGSFVNLRGGQVYPEKVLAADKKPIRICLLDGVNDNRALTATNYNVDRDWHTQNVRLVQALTSKGYDVNYAWGIGLHGQKQGGAQLPEMMRWLWRDYPRSFDPHDMTERSFRAAFTNSEATSAPGAQ